MVGSEWPALTKVSHGGVCVVLTLTAEGEPLLQEANRRLALSRGEARCKSAVDTGGVISLGVATVAVALGCWDTTVDI